MATERKGNALLKSAQCAWRNGISPGTGTFVYNEEVHVPVGLYQRVQLGDLSWCGIVEGAPTAMNEGVGKITTVVGVDITDDLQRAMAYARFNVRDDYGRLYCIMPDDWEMQTRTYSGTTMWGIIYGLAFAAGFNVSLSPYAAMNIRVGSSTYFDDSNPPSPCAWDMDWNDGQKVGTALLEICDKLGLQFTTAHSWNSSVLYISMKGEFDSGGILFVGYQGDMATEGTWGNQLNRAVDTKIDVIGQEDIHEVQNVTLAAGWDQRENGIWEEWAVDYDKFVNDLKKEGLDHYTATVAEVTKKIVGSTTVIPDIYNNEPVGSMLARDYIDIFPFRYWTVPTFSGGKYILSGGGHIGLFSSEAIQFYPTLPLAEHLVSEPDLQAIVKISTIVVTDAIMDEDGTYGIEEVERVITNGYSLDRETGGFTFEDQCFRLNAANCPVLVAPVVTVAFYGPRFRRTYGYGDRKGAVVMPSLRQLFLHDYDSWSPRGSERPLYEGERTASSLNSHFDAIKEGNWWPGATTTTWKTADMAASEVAAVKLAQQSIIAAGQRTWKGMCGHLPGGWIQQVNVTLDAESGLTETVDISNELSLMGEVTIDEINNRILRSQQALGVASKDTRDRETKIREARLNAKAAKRLFGAGFETEGGNDLGTTAGRAFAPDGEAQVVLKTSASAGDAVKFDESIEIDGKKHLLQTVSGSCSYGVVLKDVVADEGNGVTARVVIHGPVMAKVAGPVEAGDSIGLLRGAYLSPDASVMCAQALLPNEESSTKLLPVLMGTGTGASGELRLCEIAHDYENGWYDIVDWGNRSDYVAPSESTPEEEVEQTVWVAKVKVFEYQGYGVIENGFFYGRGVGHKVTAVKNRNTWYITLGYANMMPINP